ncbi:hypothetical protein LTS18_007521, partial [Coniosporium uncinatum]
SPPSLPYLTTTPSQPASTQPASTQPASYPPAPAHGPPPPIAAAASLSKRGATSLGTGLTTTPPPLFRPPTLPQRALAYRLISPRCLLDIRRPRRPTQRLLVLVDTIGRHRLRDGRGRLWGF